jgi:hypothetical protein
MLRNVGYRQPIASGVIKGAVATLSTIDWILLVHDGAYKVQSEY